jgi:hypothetical protein
MDEVNFDHGKYIPSNNDTSKDMRGCEYKRLVSD